MKDCEYFEDLLSARLDGALTPEEQEELSVHLPTCPHCQKYAKDLQHLHEALLALADDPPHWLLGDIMTGLEEELPRLSPTLPPTPVKKTRRWAGLACAAGLALVILTAAPPLFSLGGATEGEAATESTAAAEEFQYAQSDLKGGEGNQSSPQDPQESPPATMEDFEAEKEESRVEAAPSTSDSPAEFGAPLLDLSAHSQAEAQKLLEGHLKDEGREDLALEAAGLSEDGGSWLFSARKPDGSPTALFAVSQETGDIREMPAAHLD